MLETALLSLFSKLEQPTTRWVIPCMLSKSVMRLMVQQDQYYIQIMKLFSNFSQVGPAASDDPKIGLSRVTLLNGTSMPRQSVKILPEKMPLGSFRGVLLRLHDTSGTGQTGTCLMQSWMGCARKRRLRCPTMK